MREGEGFEPLKRGGPGWGPVDVAVGGLHLLGHRGEPVPRAALGAEGRGGVGGSPGMGTHCKLLRSHPLTNSREERATPGWRRSLMSALGYAQWLAGLQHGAPFLGPPREGNGTGGWVGSNTVG